MRNKYKQESVKIDKRRSSNNGVQKSVHRERRRKKETIRRTNDGVKSIPTYGSRIPIDVHRETKEQPCIPTGERNTKRMTEYNKTKPVKEEVYKRMGFQVVLRHDRPIQNTTYISMRKKATILGKLRIFPHVKPKRPAAAERNIWRRDIGEREMENPRINNKRRVRKIKNE